MKKIDACVTLTCEQTIKILKIQVYMCEENKTNVSQKCTLFIRPSLNIKSSNFSSTMQAFKI